MAAWERIIVKPNLYSRLGGRVSCARCGQTLSVGDEAWADLCSRKRRILHQLLLLYVFLEALGVTELILDLVPHRLLKAKTCLGDDSSSLALGDSIKSWIARLFSSSD